MVKLPCCVASIVNIEFLGIANSQWHQLLGRDRRARCGPLDESLRILVQHNRSTGAERQAAGGLRLTAWLFRESHRRDRYIELQQCDCGKLKIANSASSAQLRPRWRGGDAHCFSRSLIPRKSPEFFLGRAPSMLRQTIWPHPQDPEYRALQGRRSHFTEHTVAIAGLDDATEPSGPLV